MTWRKKNRIWNDEYEGHHNASSCTLHLRKLHIMGYFFGVDSGLVLGRCTFTKNAHGFSIQGVSLSAGVSAGLTPTRRKHRRSSLKLAMPMRRVCTRFWYGKRLVSMSASHWGKPILKCWLGIPAEIRDFGLRM